jgi:hypothetical protein
VQHRPFSTIAASSDLIDNSFPQEITRNFDPPTANRILSAYYNHVLRKVPPELLAPSTGKPVRGVADLKREVRNNSIRSTAQRLLASTSARVNGGTIVGMLAEENGLSGQQIRNITGPLKDLRDKI